MSLDLPGLHFGVWRSPLRTPDQVRPLIERIIASSHVTLDGIMGYEAQIAQGGDDYPGKMLKNPLVQGLNRRSARVVAPRLAAIVALVRTYGIQLCFLNRAAPRLSAPT